MEQFKKVNKKVFGFSVEREVGNKFMAICEENGWSKGKVLSYLLTEFCNNTKIKVGESVEYIE